MRTHTALERALSALSPSIMLRIEADGTIAARHRYAEVHAVVALREPNGMHIHAIECDPNARGQRNGSLLLNELCAWADAHGVRLSLLPHSIGEPCDGALCDDALAAWYKYHGFVFVGTEGEMLRVPRGGRAAAPARRS